MKFTQIVILVYLKIFMQVSELILNFLLTLKLFSSKNIALRKFFNKNSNPRFRNSFWNSTDFLQTPYI